MNIVSLRVPVLAGTIWLHATNSTVFHDCIEEVRCYCPEAEVVNEVPDIASVTNDDATDSKEEENLVAGEFNNLSYLDESMGVRLLKFILEKGYELRSSAPVVNRVGDMDSILYTFVSSN